ncbi:MAG: hypothetical protein CM15mP119_3210 [Alphaproteobacteria bacterium]|nr:MAG: hypothetical protein CM15mP119_3210 [Alphaproteobacteria bacterium]
MTQITVSPSLVGWVKSWTRLKRLIPPGWRGPIWVRVMWVSWLAGKPKKKNAMAERMASGKIFYNDFLFPELRQGAKKGGPGGLFWDVPGLGKCRNKSRFGGLTTK